jgi:predicted nucleic acid-binding protein
MNFADTNWLEALYFEAEDERQNLRCEVVERFMRKEKGQLCISQLVYLEARNVFARVGGSAEPEEWRRLVSDFNGLLYLDPINWEFLRREAFQLFARYSPKAAIGTLDMAILASLKLSGATRLLSFDETLKAVALAERIAIFPPLSEPGKRLLSRLKAVADKG